jgi:hypothetical protein
MKDDIYDALRIVIKALGGFDSVGKRLRTEMPSDKAGIWLSDATNRNRAQKLSPEQVLVIAKWGREVGCHALMDFITSDAGYEPTKPKVLAEQLAVLQARALAAKREAENTAADMQTLLENPRLFALMTAAHANTEGMA